MSDKSNGKITAYNVALGETEYTVTQQYHKNSHPSSSFLDTTILCRTLYPLTEKKKCIQVTQTTLDRWMKEFTPNIKPEGFVKRDVQGYEDRVIKGGKSLFPKAKVCLLEINLVSLYQDQTSFKELFYLLDELGYSYAGNFNQVHDIDGRAFYIDALFIRTK